MLRTKIRVCGVFFCLALFLTLCAFAVPSEAAVLCIIQNGAGTKHGSSWGNAMGESEFVATLKLPIPAGTEFWIAAGTYRPTADPNDRDATFVLQNGVAFYGGFAGTETLRKDRDWVANKTFLSGDIQNDGALFNNSCHVVFSESGTDETAVLDGFIVTSGYAGDKPFPQGDLGGGLINFGSPLVVNCTFSGNRARLGGGMFNRGSSSIITGCTFQQNLAEDGGGVYNYLGGPSFTECTFLGNQAEYSGGGMKNSNSAPLVSACTFTQNVGSFSGGGISNEKSSPDVVNCTFSMNGSAAVGGGMDNFDSDPSVINCTFFKNRADLVGGDMGNRGTSKPGVKNCIFWGSSLGTIFNHPTAAPIVEYCVVEGGYDGGTSIITGDPKLADLADNGGPTQTCAILAGSSAIDSGTASGAPGVDQRGEVRPQGSGVDLGAYESSFSKPPTPAPSSGGGCSAGMGFNPHALLLLLPLLLLKRR